MPGCVNKYRRDVLDAGDRGQRANELPEAQRPVRLPHTHYAHGLDAHLDQGRRRDAGERCRGVDDGVDGVLTERPGDGYWVEEGGHRWGIIPRTVFQPGVARATCMCT